jgi:hypothetical protein
LATGRQAYSLSAVKYIFTQFRDGERKWCENLAKSGGPRTVRTREFNEKLLALLNDDKNWGTKEYADELEVRPEIVRCAMRELRARKVASKSVPHMLSPAQKDQRKKRSEELLNRYEKNPEFLQHIIAIDESWIKSYDPKDEASARVWKLPDQKPYIF